MLFNSQLFILGFLPAVLVPYYALAGWRAARQWWVIAASLLFYASWDPRFVPLLVGLTGANWGIARAFGRWPRRWIPSLGIVLNLAVLGWCKYSAFVGWNLAALLHLPPPRWQVVLPLGLSFFTFQKIAYLVDLRRGDRHVYSLRDFCMFVFFFPQLIAGPLVRHSEIIPQFAHNPRRPQLWENLARGMVLFACGLVKKALLADAAALVSDPVFAHAAAAVPNAAEAWAGAASYALQIYFDFSGYSDMAIGMALMFGLCLPLNFDAPYRATSVRDFWRRWHITLSRFLRDYLYIPLGGNRAGITRQACNLVLTMLLGGLWHGAAWTFVLWGGLHGLGLATCALWRRAGLVMPAALGWALTMLFVLVSWVVFRATSFAAVGHMLSGMAGARGIGRFHVEGGALLMVAGMLAVLGPTSQTLALHRLRPRLWLALPFGVALAALLLLIGGRVPHEFIYFQF